MLAEPVRQFGGSGSQTEAFPVPQAEFAVDRFLAFDQFPDLLLGQRFPEQVFEDRARRASVHLLVHFPGVKPFLRSCRDTVCHACSCLSESKNSVPLKSKMIPSYAMTARFFIDFSRSGFLPAERSRLFPESARSFPCRRRRVGRRARSVVTAGPSRDAARKFSGIVPIRIRTARHPVRLNIRLLGSAPTSRPRSRKRDYPARRNREPPRYSFHPVQ